MYLFKFHQSLCWRCNCTLQLAAAVVGNGSSTAELLEAVQRGSFGVLSFQAVQEAVSACVAGSAEEKYPRGFHQKYGNGNRGVLLQGTMLPAGLGSMASHGRASECSMRGLQVQEP